MKNYFKILVIVISSGLILFACSKNEEIISSEVITNSTQIKNLSNKGVLGTCCYINGSTLTSSTQLNLCAPNAQAVVNAGSSTTYQYVNTTGISSNVIWSCTANPLNSMTLTSNGNSVNVTFSSSFINGTLSAAGSGGTAQTCNTVLNITKALIPPLDCSCTPYFAIEFYNVPVNGGGYVENSIFFTSRTNCEFNWSTVSNVKIQFGGIYGVGSNSTSLPNINIMGQSGGMTNNSNWTTTPSGYRNIKIRTHLNTSDTTPGFIRNNTLGSYTAGANWATIKFNNGCPDVILHLNDDDGGL